MRDERGLSLATKAVEGEYPTAVPPPISRLLPLLSETGPIAEC